MVRWMERVFTRQARARSEVQEARTSPFPGFDRRLPVESSWLDRPEVLPIFGALFLRFGRSYLDIPQGTARGVAVAVLDLGVRDDPDSGLVLSGIADSDTPDRKRLAAGTRLRWVSVEGSPNEGTAYLRYAVLDGPFAGQTVTVWTLGRAPFHDSVASLLVIPVDDPLVSGGEHNRFVSSLTDAIAGIRPQDT